MRQSISAVSNSSTSTPCISKSMPPWFKLPLNFAKRDNKRGRKTIKEKKSNTGSDILWILIWIISWGNQSGWQCKPFWWKGFWCHQLKGSSRGTDPYGAAMPGCAGIYSFFVKPWLCPTNPLTENGSAHRCLTNLARALPLLKQTWEFTQRAPHHPGPICSRARLCSCQSTVEEREMKEQRRVKARRLILETSRKEALKELN